MALHVQSLPSLKGKVKYSEDDKDKQCYLREKCKSIQMSMREW